MTDEQKLQKFTQSVYLTRFGNFVDDITDDDGVTEIRKTIEWTNQFLDELENELDEEGVPMNWLFMRENDKEIGEIEGAGQTFDLPAGVLRLVYSDKRQLMIVQDGSVVSYWDVIAPNQVSRQAQRQSRDSVTVVNGKIIFSRALRETEIGGTAVADVINSLPRLAGVDDEVNVEVLDLVQPKQLLILGVGKNATLPDIVQGGLSPSFTQKYADLLASAKAVNNVSADVDEMTRDDVSDIGGIY